YNTAQNGLVQLSASEDIQTKYQVLHWNQLKVTTQILQWDRSTPRDEPLEWFWKVNIKADMEQSDMVKEFYRVHWLQAKAKHKQWSEELSITQHEMVWITQYF
ncbi:hypothetical protein L208DRAFT_1047501, partial [Tricholoma matsutake]